MLGNFFNHRLPGTMSEKHRKRLGIRATVLTFFTLATTLTAALAIGLQYYFGQQQARESAHTLYTIAANAVTTEIRSLSIRNTNLIDLLASNPELAYGEYTPAQREVFISALRNNPLIHGVYVGHPDGKFVELINLESSRHTRGALGAMHSDRWVLISMGYDKGQRVRRFEYLDSELNTRIKRQEPSEFDPRKRGWYKNALLTAQSVASAPYLFDQSGETGQTVSKRVVGSDSVVALDLTMRSISDFLRQQQAAKYGELMLYNNAGEVIASSRSAEAPPELPPAPALSLTAAERTWIAQQPPLRVSNEMNWPPLDYAVSGHPEGFFIDVFRLISTMTGLEFQFVNGLTWTGLVERFRRGEIDILHPVTRSREREDWGSYSIPVLEMPISLATRDGFEAADGLAALDGKRLAIPAGWGSIPLVRSNFPGIEIVETRSTLESLKLVLSGAADATLDHEMILRYLQRHYYLEGISYHPLADGSALAGNSSLHLMVHKEQSTLLSVLNKAIAAGSEEQRAFLRDKWLGIVYDAESHDHATVPSERMIDVARDPALENALIEIEHNGQPYFVYGATLHQDKDEPLYFGVLVSEQSIVGPFMKKVWISIGITGAFLLLLTPLSWYFAGPIVRPIKQLAVENDKVRDRRYEDVQQVDTQVKELNELSESMVAMVASIRAYEEAQRRLMDAFIELIAGAIDEKSAYTGGHCERVPELALMLAAAASDSNRPPFADFRLESDDQWREYRIAAWLHDCGKITTPENIVDKGSKLEVIYNRIHEVRMRFEVLRRDAEIKYLRELAEHPDRADELQEELRREWAQLEQDFAFVAECNVGGESLDEAKRERLRAISQRTWQRYFDDRIGLSPVEELRRSGAPSPLPASEHLLQDKPEHIIPRERPAEFPPEYGINMDIPEHLYNQGEVYNLSISRGTLTAEDRFKINEHMISTIRMLESLPFPEELKNVPRYASTHHETMRGDGYPRKLPGEQLSIPERILAVADVFEALTASDRPYKKAKPISVAVDILHKMVQDGHIDRDCFELFIRGRVYLDYAERFLDPSQIDEVDISRYLDVA